MVYTFTPAAAGDLTTNATPGTETETWFLKAGVRNLYLQSMYVLGKGAALTGISGIVFRLIKWGTASTAGTTMAPFSPKDPGMQAAKATGASRSTVGTTRTPQVLFGCGAAGPGGYVAPNPDSGILLEGGGALSISCEETSNTASLKFEFSGEFQE